jgi:hypothetical protein
MTANTAGVALDRHSGAGRNPVALLAMPAQAGGHLDGCSWDDIPVLFRPPPGRACDFSLRGQREVTKRKATPRTRPASIHGLRVCSRPPGFADGPSMALRRTGALPVRHPSDFPVVRSPCSRGPVAALPARGGEQHRSCDLASVEARMASVGVEFRGVLACRRGAQPNGGASAACSSTGTCEFGAAAIRRAPRAVSATRRCRNRHAGRNGFGYFRRNESSPLANASGTGVES